PRVGRRLRLCGAARDVDPAAHRVGVDVVRAALTTDPRGFQDFVRAICSCLEGGAPSRTEGDHDDWQKCISSHCKAPEASQRPKKRLIVATTTPRKSERCAATPSSSLKGRLVYIGPAHALGSATSTPSKKAHKRRYDAWRLRGQRDSAVL